MIVKIVKIYPVLSLVLLWAVWGQFIFGQFLDPAYISQDLQAPSYVVGTNYRVYNLLHLSLPRRFPLFQLLLSVCWSLQCLISALTQGAVVDTFLGSLVQSHCGEGGTLQTNNTGMCSQYLGHTGFAPTHGVFSFPVYIAQALQYSCLKNTMDRGAWRATVHGAAKSRT